MKTTLKRLHNFLNKSLVAKLVVYALAWILPAVSYFSFVGGGHISPYAFTWVGFYSCVLIVWAYHEKPWETVANIILICVNAVPIVFWCFIACMGGLGGLFFALSTLTVPLPIVMLVDNVIVRQILILIGLSILAGMLILGIRVFLRMAAKHEDNLLKDLEERGWNP